MILMSCISTFYYIRIVQFLFFNVNEKPKFYYPINYSISIIIILITFLNIFFCCFPWLLMDILYYENLIFFLDNLFKTNELKFSDLEIQYFLETQDFTTIFTEKLIKSDVDKLVSKLIEIKYQLFDLIDISYNVLKNHSEIQLVKINAFELILNNTFNIIDQIRPYFTSDNYSLYNSIFIENLKEKTEYFKFMYDKDYSFEKRVQLYKMNLLFLDPDQYSEKINLLTRYESLLKGNNICEIKNYFNSPINKK